MELNISIKSRDCSYKIIIEPGCISKITEYLKRKPLGNRYAIITDSNVRRLYGDKLLKGLKKSGIAADIIDFPAGEEQKTRKTKEDIEDKMHALGLGRDSCILALGGGVVGDVAGFVAATFDRGINYIQIPTTLLAQVDSSVGGKVGVNTPNGKNLIGVFYQPKLVFIDTNTLKSLPEKEIKNGLAEIIKYGIIYDKVFFESLENNIERIRQLKTDYLVKAIFRSCEIKAEVVSKDEKEYNLRSILNYGHTIGHAVEKCSDYAYTHGEAVAIGMRYVGMLAARIGSWSHKELERQNKLLKRAGLPIRLPKIKAEELIEVMRVDKKVKSGDIMMVLPRGIGNMKKSSGQYRIPVLENELRKVLSEE
jgi:3-dehydroquinate synthase